MLPFSKFSTNGKTILLQITRVENNDKVNFSKFLIFVDRKNESIVLAVRGTYDFKDVLTDMVFTLVHTNVVVSSKIG